MLFLVYTFIGITELYIIYIIGITELYNSVIPINVWYRESVEGEKNNSPTKILRNLFLGIFLGDLTGKGIWAVSGDSDWPKNVFVDWFPNQEEQSPWDSGKQGNLKTSTIWSSKKLPKISDASRCWKLDHGYPVHQQPPQKDVELPNTWSCGLGYSSWGLADLPPLPLPRQAGRDSHAVNTRGLCRAISVTRSTPVTPPSAQHYSIPGTRNAIRDRQLGTGPFPLVTSGNISCQ